MGTSTAPTASEGMEADGFQQELGTRLRRVRRSRGLTLQDVEVRSRGRWKAVVVGSYERGDRAVSAAKLVELATFYGVSVDEVLPVEAPLDPVGNGRGGVRVDLDRLVAAARGDASLRPLLRLVEHVRRQRAGVTGPAVAVRAEDLAALSVVLGIPGDDLSTWLAERGLLATA